ncbi:hypothetical protein [Cupriavidus oxalaticus]|uniref:Uncharacterized protein n=1 Tax=Cupriavidus oxalaticus TaxID=96344 RepID=A0A976BBP9_9BURK|nr:hypothetical protein [Cupriavidus oxalaticus]WQD81834.1 hypothetical protein U0036_12095 [Cupriavidus oxalaticus]SPC13213.1 conserved hypothetical protein [Cupriavidus oxalaticus]
MRWALFVFCAGETAAVGLLASTLADTVAASPAGMLWWHGVLALLPVVAGVAVVGSWRRWTRGLRWRCTAMLPAPDGKGPLRVRIEAPGAGRHEVVVSGFWQAGGVSVLRLASRVSGLPGALFLPWQAVSPELSRRLQRAARVALQVQPETAARERVC